MAFGDRHLARNSFRNPVSGAYFTVACFLPLNGDNFKFLVPCQARIVEISRYCETSTGGTFTVSNTTKSVTWVSAAALTADTVNVTAAAALGAAGSQECSKGDSITVTAGGTATNVCAVLTFWAKDHVAADEAND